MSAIQSKALLHEQEYLFKFHTHKLESLTKYEPGLRDYLFEIYQNCPDEFFYKSLRCSRAKLKNVNLKRKPEKNLVMDMAKTALRGISNNRMRHPAVQDFMLEQDSSTIACEVPVYLAPWEIPLQRRFGKYGRSLSGHIDILQVREDKIWILDYKPNARYNVQSYMTQVFLYRICLSARTGIPSERIGIAYFDDKDYYEVNTAKQGELIKI